MKKYVLRNKKIIGKQNYIHYKDGTPFFCEKEHATVFDGIDCYDAMQEIKAYFASSGIDPDTVERLEV